MSISDQQLISSASGGSNSDFEELYRRHVGTVFAFLCRCTGEEAEAEDLTQEVFVRAWENLRQFRNRSGFATWLIDRATERDVGAEGWHRGHVSMTAGDFDGDGCTDLAIGELSSIEEDADNDVARDDRGSVHILRDISGLALDFYCSHQIDRHQGGLGNRHPRMNTDDLDVIDRGKAFHHRARAARR